MGNPEVFLHGLQGQPAFLLAGLTTFGKLQYRPRESFTLRGECVQEVKRLNGAFSFEDAYRWQKE